MKIYKFNYPILKLTWMSRYINLTQFKKRQSIYQIEYYCYCTQFYEVLYWSKNNWHHYIIIVIWQILNNIFAQSIGLIIYICVINILVSWGLLHNCEISTLSIKMNIMIFFWFFKTRKVSSGKKKLLAEGKKITLHHCTSPLTYLFIIIRHRLANI